MSFLSSLKFVGANSQYAWSSKVSTSIGDFTWSFWIKIPDSPPSADMAVVMNGDDNGHEGYGILVKNDGTIELDMIFVNGSCKTTAKLQPNTKTHVIVEKSSGTSTIYLNTIANGTTSASTPNTINVDAVTTIGCYATKGNPPTSPSNFFTGQLWNLMAFDRALSATERVAAYNFPQNLATTSLDVFWKFNENSGNPIDSSTNKVATTLVNAPKYFRELNVSNFLNYYNSNPVALGTQYVSSLATLGVS